MWGQDRRRLGAARPASSPTRTRTGTCAPSTTAAPFYDHARPWITHASVQRIDVYRTAENTDAWRRRSTASPSSSTSAGTRATSTRAGATSRARSWSRRFWEGAVRGGYVAHGETYLNDARGTLVVQGRRAHRARAPIAWAFLRPDHRRGARRRHRPAPVGLGRAVGRRRRRAPDRATSGSTARASGTSRCPRALRGRRDRHVEHDGRDGARREAEPCGSNCPRASTWPCVCVASTPERMPRGIRSLIRSAWPAGTQEESGPLRRVAGSGPVIPAFLPAFQRAAAGGLG